ncbi:MAG: transposase [Fimbriimonadaceae bacterium]
MEIAQIVVNAIRHGEEQLNRYRVHAFVVMPNHVHMMATANVAASKWLGALKGFTGNQANQLLKRSGPFWQGESYDHLVRNATEFDRIRRYIENNPVSAGLVSTPEAWPWSSASPTWWKHEAEQANVGRGFARQPRISAAK